ncbi:TPA: hypothetical protein P7Z58_005078, partial [Enterobacter cloacae]|nr:hypothetical protein [Enterobacter cloacae]
RSNKGLCGARCSPLRQMVMSAIACSRVLLEAIVLRKKVNNCDDARKTQTNQPAINKNMTLPHTTLFPESPSQIPNFPYTKLLYLYSVLYNEHRKLRRMAKEVSKNI